MQLQHGVLKSPLNREAKLAARCSARREASLVLPNQRVLISSAKFAPLSEVKGVPTSVYSITYTASALRDASKISSRKARTKALYSASCLRHNAKIKAPLCAKSEATVASLLALYSVNVALGGGAKSLASSSEANATSKVVLTSPVIKKRSFNARIHQFEQPSILPPRVSVLDCLNSVNPDLREFLNNRRKFCCEELSHASPSRCERAGCQLVTVRSVHCRLGPGPTTLPARQSVFKWLSTQAPVKPQKKNKAWNVPDLLSASVNMIGRGREPLKTRW